MRQKSCFPVLWLMRLFFRRENDLVLSSEVKFSSVLQKFLLEVTSSKNLQVTRKIQKVLRITRSDCVPLNGIINEMYLIRIYC